MTASSNWTEHDKRAALRWITTIGIEPDDLAALAPNAFGQALHLLLSEPEWKKLIAAIGASRRTHRTTWMSRGTETLADELEYMRADNRDLMREIGELRREIARLNDVLAVAQAENKTLTNERDQVDGPIPEEILRALLVIAHPDRHQNSPTATKVMAWLNQYRGRRPLS